MFKSRKNFKKYYSLFSFKISFCFVYLEEKQFEKKEEEKNRHIQGQIYWKISDQQIPTGVKMKRKFETKHNFSNKS